MNPDRILRNHSRMTVRCLPMDDRNGREVAVAIVKLSYSVSPEGVVRRAAAQREIRLADIPTSDARWASVRLPSDLADEKPGTDVLLVGTAHPPPDRAVTSMDVRLRVEARTRTLIKTLRVHGPRVFWQAPLGVVPGPAAALAPTPLVYELAYGGVDDTDPEELRIDWRNPAGRGAARDPARLIGARAPQIEDPHAPLDGRAPGPAGFGPIPASWAPRRALAGTYDASWQRERAPFRPLDFDPRHHCVAPVDQWCEAPLAGDEPVEILGATPSGVWRFQLPRRAPSFRAVIEGQPMSLPTHLDTMLIDADEGIVELCWRASVPVPRKSDMLDALVVYEEPQAPDAPDRAAGGRRLPLLRG